MVTVVGKPTLSIKQPKRNYAKAQTHGVLVYRPPRLYLSAGLSASGRGQEAHRGHSQGRFAFMAMGMTMVMVAGGIDLSVGPVMALAGVTGAKAVVGLPSSFGYLAEGNLLGLIPVPLVAMLSLALATHFLLSHTRAGRYGYAIGSNIEAAARRFL
jgi:ribose/xylose/arabinose/galactoside ABC-type transport system permease subunit